MSDIKLKFIVHWFGPFPSFFEHWKVTVSHNPDIDILFLTDQKVENPPPNLEVINRGFEEQIEWMQERTDTPFTVNIPYKICDIRPLFGEIYEEELKGYDFWGWMDVDLLLGRFRVCYNDSMLDHYDVFSSRPRQVSGSLFFLRNNEENRYLYKKNSKLLELIQDPTPHAVDEDLFIFCFGRIDPHYLLRNPQRTVRMTNRKKMIFHSDRYRFVNEKVMKNLGLPWENNERYFPEVYEWENGVLTVPWLTFKEYPYLDLVKYKGKNFLPNEIDPNCTKWIITTEGIYNAY